MNRFGCGAGAALALALYGTPAAAQPARSPTNEDCQVCHADASTTRANGRPVVIPPEKFAASSHAAMACVDCHADLARITEFPHPEKLARVQCASCHEEAAAAYDRGIHARARRENPQSPAATCADCHTAHEIKSSKDPAASTYKLTLVATCSRCHGDPAVIERGHIAAGNVPAVFQDSIHGRALAKSGLIVAPACGDCHGTHDIQPKSAPESRVHLSRVPATCGACHAGVRHEFDQSVHGQAIAKGLRVAPACHTCHTAHGIQRTENPRWQLGAVEECGTCHAEALRTYRDTFHGQVTALGFARVAKCADCHTPHTIFSKEDPRSSVSRARLVDTCRRCHPSANENFVKYDPHADKHDRQGSPALYYAATFMNVLLAGVFAFFGLHTSLWFWRGFQSRRAAPPPQAPDDDDNDAGVV